MEHHADFAVPVAQRLYLETDYDRPDGGKVAGRALALGWWVDPPGSDPAGGGEPIGTLYLVVDESLPRPVWVAQGRVTRTQLGD
jgi:hypothetical protein